MNKSKRAILIYSRSRIVGVHLPPRLLHNRFDIVASVQSVVPRHSALYICGHIKNSLVMVAPKKDSLLSKFKERSNKFFALVPILLKRRGLIGVVCPSAYGSKIPVVSEVHHEIGLIFLAESQQGFYSSGVLLISVDIAGGHELYWLHFVPPIISKICLQELLAVVAHKS